MQGEWTPLQIASLYNKTECLELLLSHGAEVNVKNKVNLVH